jgi:dipeptidyl aminopeptidase/acylaminoacyl peptidase
MPGLAISPDGTTLAIQTWADETSQDDRLLTVRLDGTGFRELHGPFPGGGGSDRLSWAPDGQSLLFVRQTARGPEGSWQVIQVPATGGAALPDGLDSSYFASVVPMPRVETGNVANIDVSADGTRLVFSSRTIPTCDLSAPSPFPPLSLSATAIWKLILTSFEHRT